jgi:Xaa-Pro aminopeptidase
LAKGVSIAPKHPELPAMNVSAQHSSGLSTPFDHKRLDRLMDAAGIDVVVATSKHNVQYLLGGHRADFFDYMDATGVTRYLPVLVYPKGAPEKAAYIGHRLEKFQREVNPMWTPETQTSTAGSVDAMQKAVEHMRKLGLKPKRVAAEFGFLPYDASIVLRGAFPDADLVDALFVLERQRVKKSADELAKLKVASEAVLDSMKAVIANHGPGATKRDVVDALRREETNRGLTFEYCLITCGTSLNRAPSDQKWEKGDIMSIDSGGNYHGYIGDICRMAIQGEPDAELVDLLGEIELIQRAAMKPIKAGAMGREIYAAGEALRTKSKRHNHMEFLAHGMGLVSHEAPRLTDHGPVPYPATDSDIPLEAGSVVSVETSLLHPTRGFIKLEDTVVVTDTGHDIYAEGARDWNRAGTSAKN